MVPFGEEAGLQTCVYDSGRWLVEETDEDDRVTIECCSPGDIVGAVRTPWFGVSAGRRRGC